jgi:hypothetical protein
MIDEHINRLMEKAIRWDVAQEHNQYSAVEDGQTVYLRLNNFPDEPLCTITIGQESKDMDAFSELWTLSDW